MPAPTTLTIGEFSRITHLSIRTLRRYHEQGLVEPATVDGASGYRRYTLDQVPNAQVIHRFRDLGLPLADVKALLATSEPADRAVLLAEHLARLRGELERTRTAVEALQRLLAPAASAVEVRRRPATAVAAVREVVAHDDVLDWYDAAMSALVAAVGERRAGPPGGLFDHDLFTDGRGAAVLYLPCATVVPTGRVEALTLPAREAAVVTHHGPHDDIDLSYAALGSFVAERAVGVDGPVEEVYLVGPADDPDPASWRTEVAWPVFRTTGLHGGGTAGP